MKNKFLTDTPCAVVMGPFFIFRKHDFLAETPARAHESVDNRAIRRRTQGVHTPMLADKTKKTNNVSSFAYMVLAIHPLVPQGEV